jgi:hypothetical protein
MSKSQELLSIVTNGLGNLSDFRKGKNTKYSIKDIYLAGYRVFHLQSPSFLAHQERISETRGNQKLTFKYKIYKNIPLSSEHNAPNVKATYIISQE